MGVGLLQRCASEAGVRRRARRYGEEAPAMVHLQELAGNCACQRLAQAASTNQQALLTTATSQSVGRTLTVLRLAEEEPPAATEEAPAEEAPADEAPAEEGCTLEVLGPEETKPEEGEAETVARSAEPGLVKVADVGAEGTGNATVLCDGQGGFRVDLGMYKTYPCGVANCVEKHENSHIEDMKRDGPNSCKGPNGSQPDFRVPNPDQYKRTTECKASRVEIGCLTRTKVTNPGCRTVLGSIKKKVRDDIRNWCGG